MSQLQLTGPILKLLFLGGLLIGTLALTMDAHRAGLVTNFLTGKLTPVNTPATPRQPDDCQGEVNPNVMISREQLASFLTISERDVRTRVEQVLSTPYCHLANLEIRAGVQSERTVYPLAFDPQTWLVVLYEGEEYAGYQFRIQR